MPVSSWFPILFGGEGGEPPGGGGAYSGIVLGGDGFMSLGDFMIDDLVEFPVVTRAPSTGAKMDATSLTYTVYKQGVETPIAANVDITPFKVATGKYLPKLTATESSGYERGKSYAIFIDGEVDGADVSGVHTLTIEKGVVQSDTALAEEGLTSVPQLSEIGAEAADAILVTPENKLATNASGQVTAASVVGGVGGDIAGDVDGSVGSLGATAVSQVAAQVAAFFAAAAADPTGAPAENASRLEVLLWAAFREILGREGTASEERRLARDGSTIAVAPVTREAGLLNRGNYTDPA